VSGPPLDPGAAPAVGRPVALSPRVVRVTAPNPGMMTGPGTNSYVVGTTDRAVVDPGPDVTDDGMAGHLEALVAAAEDRIRWIVVTHTHLDHSPAAAALRARTGAEVIGFDARDGLVPDRSVTEGFTLTGPGFALRALHTPGHASNHLCWLLGQEGMLFSGDHVMAGSTVVIAPPDGDMVVYLHSLRRLLVLDPPLATIAPGHGPLLTDPAATVQAVIAHRLEREALVLQALEGTGPTTVEALLPLVYSDVRAELVPVAAKSLWAHLRKLAGEGRAASTDVDDNASTWVATG
jgi:glyoxylase-like metal-dependent hydrolase (beta-lactamase superfamily II)